MNIPDQIHISTSKYSGLCFAHAVKLVIEEEAHVEMNLSDTSCQCDICEEKDSIRVAQIRNNKVIWTREMIDVLPDTIDLYMYDKYRGKTKCWVALRVTRDNCGSYNIRSEGHDFLIYDDAVSVLKWLNDHAAVRAEDKEDK